MRLILIGPPGSGKGTQAEMLAERNTLLHFGMGDELREVVRLGTPAGLLAAPYVSKGQLVPDVVVNEMIRERFQRADGPRCFVMDGYPRTRVQAATFDEILRELALPLDAAVQLVVEDEEIVRRLSGRWICPKCHASYHTRNRPPHVPGVCDRCRTALVQREDDREETVRERLTVYNQRTAELATYYGERGLLRQVPGLGTIEEIYQKIMQAVGVH